MEDRVTAHLATVLSFDWNNNNNNAKLRYEIGVYATLKKETDIRFLLTQTENEANNGAPVR